MLHLSDNIKKFRELKGISQQKVADEIGEKRSTYAEWERGIEPKASALVKIAKVLGVSTSQLLEGIDDKPAIEANTVHQKSLGHVPAEELIQVLKEHNEFLRRNFELSLAGISIQAASILAHVATSLEKDDEREAAGNTEKLRQLKTDTGRRIGEKLVVSVKNDKKVAGS